MRTPRAPGAHPADIEKRFVPMTLGPTGVPGFVGVAARGPTDSPVRLTSFTDFQAVFGSLEIESYLEPAVAGFFGNGGRVCYVLRVAHQVSRAGEQVASAACAEVMDEAGRPTLQVSAANQGRWGNLVKVEVRRQQPRFSSLLTLDLREGDTAAVVRSTHGITRGATIRFRDGDGEVYRTVTELSGKTINWSSDQPLGRGFRSGAPTYVEPLEFELTLRWRSARERYRNLSMSPSSDQYVERVVNTESSIGRVVDLRTESPVPTSYPGAVDELVLEGGTDGLFTVTPEDFIGANIGPGERYGLSALEAIEEIDLLVIPDLVWALEGSNGFRTERDVQVVQDAMVTQCERQRTRLAILDFPNPADHQHASSWRLLFDSAHAAFYFPWIQVEHAGTMKFVPPCGHVAGVYARCDREMGPYRAPANEELEGVYDLARVLRDDDIGRLNDEGINCLKSFARRGIRVWGARTASNDPAWRYVNVRRVVGTVVSSVERGLQWAVFETNNQFLWKTLTRQLTSFLLDLWKEGYFKGRRPEEAFFVKCDLENNPPEVRDAGQVIIECGVAPVRPAEFLVFKVSADMEDLGQTD